MITVKHSDITIEYREQMNVWTAEDEDKEIDLERKSLSEMKKAIDDVLRAKQEGRFKRFTAFKLGRGWDGGHFETVTVTSILENRTECWISYPKRSETERASREKTYLSNLYIDTPANQKITTEINELLDETGRIRAKIDSLKEKLTGLNIKDEE